MFAFWGVVVFSSQTGQKKLKTNICFVVTYIFMICPHYSYYAVSEFFPEKFRNEVQDNNGKVSINIVAVNLEVEFHSYQYFQKVPTKRIRYRGYKLFTLLWELCQKLIW